VTSSDAIDDWRPYALLLWRLTELQSDGVAQAQEHLAEIGRRKTESTSQKTRGSRSQSCGASVERESQLTPESAQREPNRNGFDQGV